ncbi:MAG TPA: SWIB/MDM2 domain-containing protein [Pyrinomonadaceae bacterium]|nr:SWIB/MDM2 domain-containing protein [Pyrinomonadaceae bacterium]
MVSLTSVGQVHGPTTKRGGRGLTELVVPSRQLAAVIGPELRPRSEVTKNVWDYIKRHRLQDPNNKRMISADESLRAVFSGKGRVSMFEMAAMVNRHLTPASDYVSGLGDSAALFTTDSPNGWSVQVAKYDKFQLNVSGPRREGVLIVASLVLPRIHL